jgi:transposase-like protein
MATFAGKYAPKYDDAVKCLLKDRDTLLTFFDFPAEHWVHRIPPAAAVLLAAELSRRV